MSWWVAGVSVGIVLGAFALRTFRHPKVLTPRRAPYVAAVRLAAAAADSATKRTPQGCAWGIKLYSQATDIDTLYADAWGGLAKTHALCALFTDNPNVEFPAARSAAAKALSLDSTLSSALTASGMVHVFHEQDFPAAQHDFALAIKYDPTQYEAWLFRAWAYLGDNQPDSAESAMRTARDLRPVGDPTVGVRLATILRIRGDYAGARRELGTMLARDPNDRLAAGELFELEVLLGQCDSARQRLSGHVVTPIQYNGAVLASYWAKCGHRGLAQRYADSVAAQAATGSYVDHFALAMVDATLADSQALFRSLNQAVDEHNWALFFLRVHWAFKRYRDTPAFADIMRRAHVK